MNAKDETNGQTALMFASALGRVLAVRMLARQGADLDAVTNVTEIIKREYRYIEKQKDRNIRYERGEESSRHGRYDGRSILPRARGI